MLRSDPGEFRRPAPKQRENSRTVFLRSMHTWCERNKSSKGILGRVGGRLAAGLSLLQGLVSTPARRGIVCSRLTAKASLVQREVANEMSRRDCRQKPCLSFISPSAGRGLLQGLVSTPARRGIVCSRLSASRSFTKGIHLYACPAWGYFSVKKSNQKSLGEDPETP